MPLVQQTLNVTQTEQKLNASQHRSKLQIEPTAHRNDAAQPLTPNVSKAMIAPQMTVPTSTGFLVAAVRYLAFLVPSPPFAFRLLYSSCARFRASSIHDPDFPSMRSFLLAFKSLLCCFIAAFFAAFTSALAGAPDPM